MPYIPPPKYSKEDIEDLVDKLLAAKAKEVRAGIDASACQTRRDWENYHTAQREFETARDEFSRVLGELKVLKRVA